MTILVGDVVASARDELLDPQGVQWVDATIMRWLNDVLAAAASLKRDIYPQVTGVPLTPGSVQALPAGLIQFMEPYYNTNTGKEVTKAGLALVARRIPAWRSATPTADVQEAMADERAPNYFHVYPPNTGTGNLTCLVGGIPYLNPATTPGLFSANYPTSAAVPGYLSQSQAVIPILDNYRSALVEGLCAKALFANTRRQDVNRANLHWQKFEGGILSLKVSIPEATPKLSEKAEA